MDELKEQVYNFKAQLGPQYDFIECPVQDILYGGARGGGKSFGILGHFLAKAAETYSSLKKDKCFNGLLIRRSYPELQDILKKADIIFNGIADYTKHTRTYTFTDKQYGKATLRFSYLDKDKDADRYQGHDYQWLGVEEAGNFPNSDLIYKLHATLRSPFGSKTYAVMTANPGGVGHNWLKSDYIDPSPPLKPFKVPIKVGDEEFIATRVFIPAKVTDNKVLMEKDPGYVARIVASAAGNKNLLKAWLEGDWNIVAGGMFDDIWDPDHHVVKPFDIPRDWKIYRALDWGSTKPFSVGWWAKSNGDLIKLKDGTIKKFPAGTLFRILEWYGWNGKPNEGLKMVDRDIAKEIRRIETANRWDVLPGPADWNIYEESQGKCLADDYEAEKIYFEPADKGKRVSGWQKMREVLMNSKKSPMELPGLFVFDICRHFIRTVPVLSRSSKIPDDVDTDSEDHVADETRYMIRHDTSVLEIRKFSGI